METGVLRGKSKSSFAVTGASRVSLLMTLCRLKYDKLVWVDWLPRMP